MRSRLNCISMEQNAFCLAYSTDLRYRLYCSHLIIGKHDGYESCIIPDSILYVSDINYTVRLWSEICYLKTFLFEFCHCMKDGMMLDIECDEMLLALLRKSSCSAQQSLIISLRTARGKVYLIRILRIDASCNDSSCLIKDFLCTLSVTVKTVRVAVIIVQTLYQLVSCCLTKIRSCSVVRIYLHVPLSPPACLILIHRADSNHPASSFCCL